MTTGTEWKGAYTPSGSHVEIEVGVPLRAEGGDGRPERESWLQIEASSTFGPMKPTLQLPDSFFFFFPSLLTVDMTLVLVRNQISFKVN